MTSLWAGHSASSRPDHKERARSDQEWVGRERPELISGQSFSANLECFVLSRRGSEYLSPSLLYTGMF